MNTRIAGSIALWIAMMGCAALAADGTTERKARPAFQDVDAWSDRLDSARRDEAQKPDEVIAALNLPRDAVVADIGSGTGYFAVRLARTVPQGRVYGADTEPAMVHHLAQRAAAEGLANLHAVQATREHAALPEPVDLVLVVNVQGLLKGPGDYFARLRASLKPRGRVAIIAYRPEAPVRSPAAARVPAQQVKANMARDGYALVAEHEFLPYQYFLIFQPAPI